MKIIPFMTIASALAVSACAGSTGASPESVPRVTTSIEREAVVVRVDALSDRDVEVQNATYVSGGPGHPGIGLVVKQGAREVPPCALVNFARPQVDPDVRRVSRSSSVSQSFGIEHIQRMHCLRPGEYQVQAFLVQPAATYWSNEVGIRIR